MYVCVSDKTLSFELNSPYHPVWSAMTIHKRPQDWGADLPCRGRGLEVLLELTWESSYSCLPVLHVASALGDARVYNV